MTELNRAQMKALYKLFDVYALDDQRNYYEKSVSVYRLAASQVNRLRALFAFLTGFASAAAGLIVQYSFNGSGQCLAQSTPDTLVGMVNAIITPQVNCTVLQGLVIFFMILAVVMPALGGAFNILADLYQWDRLITIYDTALENIEVADSRSPDDEMDDMTYRASLHAFAEGTLTVMYDETAQWGQLIRTPPTLDQFLAQEEAKANQVSQGATGASMGGDSPIPVPTLSPTVQPPVTQPPVTQPPVTQSPVAQPPVAQPPTAQPPSVPPTLPVKPPSSNPPEGSDPSFG